MAPTPSPSTAAPSTRAPPSPSPPTIVPTPAPPSPTPDAPPTPSPPTIAPTSAPPCPEPEIVASFTTSSEFNETAPLTFGGEVYVRATVIINAYTSYGRIFGFESTTTPGKPYSFTVSQQGTSGALIYMGKTGTVSSLMEGVSQVPLGKPFLFELTITRDSTVSGDGNDALAIMYINHAVYAHGPVALPTRVTRNSNYIGHSHISQGADLDGTVSDFQLLQCVPVPPCPDPVIVASFNT
eukprot:TRINITY_DN1217_c0_g1_i7.p1 TRINITY_DN1217_c0_g1~~TRINITY_DN1217_c0_g1_i7.p1  ORF type:complete len:277 (+),score=6.09 TRINITY_DN1217_c0_g1_i7:117-833(+)